MAEVVDVQARLSSVRPPETALHMGALRIASGSDGLRDAAGAAPLSRSASAQELSEQARAVEASLEMLGLLEPSILPGMSSEGDGREAEGSHSAGGTGTTLAEATRDGSGGGGGGYRHRLSVHISREVRKSRDTDACELVGGAEGDVLPAPTASTAPGQLGEQHPFPHTVAEAEVLEAVTARVGAEIVRDTPADLVLRSVRAFQHEKRRKGRPWADMSTERLRLVLSWRASSRIDLLADETDTAELRRFDELWRFDVCGTDGWGHPVVWDCTGSADFKRLLAELGEGRTVELFLRRLELLRRSKLLEAAKRGHAVYKHVWIVDLTGLSVGSLRRENRELLARAARSLNETYPESMLKVYVVNAPRLFSVGWRLLYPLLDPVSAAKFSIMGPLDEGCRAALAEAGVDADFLAASMGRAGARRSAA